MNMLVDVETAVRDLGITNSEYMDMVNDLKEYVAENEQNIRDCISRDNSSGVQEIAEIIKDVLKSLHFVVAEDIADRLIKSVGRNTLEDPEILFIELKHCINRTLRFIGKI